MPRTAIETIEYPLPPALAARAQLATLGPLTRHMRTSAWQFNRRPFGHDAPLAAGGRLGKIYLGEDLGAELEGAPAPISLRTAPQQGSGDTVSYSLYVENDSGLAGAQINIITTPVIPYDARIVGASLQRLDANALQWNIALVDSEYSGAYADLPPGMIIQAAGFREAGSGQSQWEPVFGVVVNNLGAVNQATNYASAIVGALVPAGKRIAFIAVSYNLNSSCTASLTLTLQRIAVPRASASTITRIVEPRAAAAARAAAEKQSATAARAAAAAAKAPSAPARSFVVQPKCLPCDPLDIHPGWWCNPLDGAYNSPEAAALRAQKCAQQPAPLPEQPISSGPLFSFGPESTEAEKAALVQTFLRAP